MKDYVPKDTLLALIPEYKKTIEEYLDRNDGENAIYQHTKYNYDLHVKQREKAQQQLFLSLIVLAAMVILTLGCFTWIFYDKFRRADKSISFMTAIKLLKEEKDNGELTSGADNGAESTINTPKFSDIKKNILSKISSGNMDSSVISPILRNSDLYKELEEKIKREANITASEETQIWSELKTLVESVSPGFDYRLQVLTEGRMTSNEHRMAMLIKCGFTNKECSILFGRQKSTISSHRRNLASKITGERKSDSTLDRLIMSL